MGEVQWVDDAGESSTIQGGMGWIASPDMPGFGAAKEEGRLIAEREAFRAAEAVEGDVNRLTRQLLDHVSGAEAFAEANRIGAVLEREADAMDRSERDAEREATTAAAEHPQLTPLSPMKVAKMAEKRKKRPVTHGEFIEMTKPLKKSVVGLLKDRTFGRRSESVRDDVLDYRAAQRAYGRTGGRFYGGDGYNDL